MNKKFSTLLATLLVAGGMTSVSAAVGNGVKKVEDLTYQLATSDNKLLVMDKNTDGSYTASLTNNADYSASLWNVKVIKEEGVAPKFKLVNKVTGCPLSVDLAKLTTDAKAVNLGGNVSEWNWLGAEKSENGFDVASLYSYYTADSVVYLVNDNGVLKAAKDAYEKVKPNAVATGGNKATFQIKPVVVEGHVLTAKELNTKLGADPSGVSFKLTAETKINSKGAEFGENAFTSTTFRAWNTNWKSSEVVGKENEKHELYAYASEDAGQPFAPAALSEKNHGYVLLQVIDGVNDDKFYEDTYQLVDTAYQGIATDSKVIAFGTDKLVAEKRADKSTPLKAAAAQRTADSYLFQFEYFATNDSIAISVRGYNDKASSRANGTASWWTEENTENKLVALTRLSNTIELTVLNTTDASKEYGVEADGTGNIKFLLDTKAATSNFTSVANNVYTIKNNKGQYLAVPIYNSNKATSYAAAEWVTVSEQEVNHMPAYQWVVVKENTGADFEKTAPVKMTNREFVAVNDANVQLRQGGEFMYVVGSNLDSVSFNAVPEEYIKDKYLGYMNLDENDLKVMTYNFNYFNPYVSDKYIGFDGDSLLTVKNGKDAFYLVKNAADKYGYVSDGSEGIKGLVKQLVRFSYSPYMKNAKGVQYVGLDEEDQYYVAPSAKTAKNFFFKENNFYQPEGAEAARPYYAFVDLTAAQAATKAGTSDQTMSAVLKNQVMEETRTSAFAVTTNDVPLYRRFNSVTLDGAVAGNEDAVKLLKFKETYRGNEYLMDEANETFKNEGVNYLGIWTADKKAAGLSFNVDTAVLSLSTAGKIKPQYFIYVSKEVVEAIPGVPCDATDHKHMDVNGKPCDADHCIHATPAKAGYTVAKYLVSFADSLNAKDANKLYQYGKYTRVGFVKALKMDEKLYFLKNGLQNVAAKDLDLDDVKKYSDVVDLKALSKDDNHHNYTWSFRYVDPEAAANEVEEDRAFLFESNNYDGVQVAPSNAAWLKIQNGCLVLTDNASTFENAKLGEDNALIFNIEKGSADDMATENETITTSNVVIAATEGAVVVKGAEGKTVTVATILGKVVANQVLSSDNATIAAPAGVVVVSVDGESFKVVVK